MRAPFADILILADDLTGAADCAVACAARGAETVVSLGAEAPRAAVLAVDVNSRALPPDEAGARMARAVERLHHAGTLLYQKIDSTLRGNWAAEIARVRREIARRRGDPLVVVAPAFPATGRVLRGGRIFVHGRPLEATEARRRRDPMDVPARLAGCGLRVALAGRGQLRTPTDAWQAPEFEAVVCDAESDEDLDAIAAASLRLARPVFWAGSAGLMRSLAAALIPAAAAPPARLEPGPVLTVVGSASPVSRAQFEALAAAPWIGALEAPPETLRRGARSAEAEFGRALDAALAKGDAAVAIAPEPGVGPEQGPRLAAALAGLVAPRMGKLGALVVTGGETARAVLTGSDISALRLRGEIEAGVPLGTGIGACEIPIVTKAGGFGTPETLLRCRAALRAGMRAPVRAP